MYGRISRVVFPIFFMVLGVRVNLFTDFRRTPCMDLSFGAALAALQWPGFAGPGIVQ
jgi:hypothetical protein